MESQIAPLCTHERILDQMERTPEAIAVAWDGGELSYRDLGRQAHRLAHLLIGLGVGPDVPVGILLAPSPRMIVSLLAILEAGGAYLPLDPSHPAERLALVLGEVEPAVVLTEEGQTHRFPPGRWRVLSLDSEEALGLWPETPPPARAMAGSLAYILYTSGSTGRPKGVAICHSSLGQYLSWVEEALLPGIDLLPLVTPLTFDACLKQIFAPLLTGRPVWILPPETLSEPGALMAALGRQRSQHSVALNCVPALWAAILEQMGPMERAALNGRLNKLFLGGERLSESLVEKTLEALPGLRIHNLYGPTEGTANASMAIVGSAGEVSLGRPVAKARLKVLGPELQPVGPGGAGELHIGGEGLARGYFRCPDLTAERFVPDPLAEEPGARLYRTGDLVGVGSDGTLQFLGRIDLQVKIRGIRIELEEIEAVLEQHPQVREAAVTTWEVVDGDRRLAGYVVLQEPAPEIRELRDFLRRTLPDPMIPTVFVGLDSLPRTSAGKLDRRALPEPDLSLSGPEGSPVAPRTPVEEILAGIWAGALGRERVGIHDSFFDLGGHSLLATRLAASVRETFGVELSLRNFFERPTVAGVAAFLAESRDHRRALAPPIPPILPAPRDGRLPLSFSQLRQWFLVQMDPGTAAYNISLALRLTGILDVPALGSALDEILRRHEALRTIFAVDGGEPSQAVGPPAPVTLRYQDLSECRGAVESHMREEVQAPFDLGRGPLWRASLFRLGEREHVLLLVLHHIVSDGWSLGVLTSELAALYESFSQGKPSPLPELSIQYGDYALWQRNWLQGEVLRREVEHWRSRLAGAPPMLPLPADRPRPAMQAHRGATETLCLPEGLGAALRDLSLRERSTLFMVLLASFAILLQRYTAEDDVSAGTFVANRRWKEIEPLVGMFVNTLVLRSDASGDPAFRDLLARVRRVTLEAYEHQDVPFEALLQELEPQRDASRTAFFQTMLVLQNYPLSQYRLPDLALDPLDTGTGGAKAHCDLTLWMWENGEDLEGYLEYDADLFDRATVRRITLHWQNLLTAVAEGARTRISNLPLLSSAERWQLLAEWGTAGEPPSCPLVHDLIELQAKQTPDAVAVIGEGEALTYADLDRRAEGLAWRLRQLGVSTDSVVGLYCRRSPQAVVGILGILKAGGAYLPLDPDLPSDRLSLLVRDSRASTLLAGEALPAGMNDFTGQVLPLREESWTEARHRKSSALPESGAYLLYTSGSTGAPKGVLIPHVALASFIDTARDLYQVKPQDRILQFSSLSFDISVEEIFTCLTTGATLLLRTDDMLTSPAHLLRVCGEWGVTVIDLPTAYWHEMSVELARGGAGLPRSLRLVIIGGERALQERLADWQRAAGGRVRLVNTYGPTETTSVATAYDSGLPAAQGCTNGVPIGRPIRGRCVYGLDRELRPVPTGVAGELYIGGTGMARGYHRRPDRTAERFLPCPFASRPGERLYRSGDLIRWLPDGNLEFLGRTDDQVKIRGFRVEPGEIAAALCRHPGIHEAVVIPREDGRGGGRLAAYAAAAAGTTAGELREFLKARLPAFLVPADFVLMEALPRTPLGKLDRRSLPLPETLGAEVPVVPPGTPTEEWLVEIWQDLLGRERLGIHDNFFDLGGHSLLVPQLLAKVQEAFQIELPMRVLFEAPTVARLALILEEILLEQIDELSEDEARSLIAEDAGLA